MLINGTFLNSPHLLGTGSKLNYILLHVPRINGAHPFSPHLQGLNDDIWLTPSFVFFNCFCIPEVGIQWITMGKISMAIQVF